MDGVERATPTELRPELRAIATRLDGIEAQGTETLTAIRSLLTLLVPRDGADRGEEFRDALAEVIALERRILEIASANQRSLHVLVGDEKRPEKANGVHRA